MYNDKYVVKFYNEVCNSLDGDYKVILEPNRNLKEDWIEYDTVKWELEEPLKKIVEELKQDNALTFEEKLFKVYEYICINYVYDDNVLYFFKKDTSNPDNVKYIAVDWYGRVVDDNWKEKRKIHNRRICYEFSRFYAKALNELLDENTQLEAFMLGDKENTHYVVGLTGKEYSVILDQDDFNSIKDLTRLKLGLTIKGVKILRDETGKFKKALDKFNKNRLEELEKVKIAKQTLKETNKIEYFKQIIEILNSYKIDSQGFCEYMRVIIEDEGIEIEKVWREVKSANEKRYSRCLVFEFESKKYILDNIDKTLRITNNEEISKNYVLDSEKKDYPYFGG